MASKGVHINMILIGICMLGFITCRTLRYFLDNKNHLNDQMNESNECSSGFQSHVIGHNLNEPFSTGEQEDLTMEAILRYPCILTKITSLLNIRTVRIIISKGHVEFERRLSKCNDTRGPVFKSVELIEGDENNHDNLKRHLLQFLSRDVSSYIVLCKYVCSNLIMSMATMLGFSSGLYVWITMGNPVFVNEIKYPKRWVSVIIKQYNKMGTRSAKVKEDLQFHHFESQADPSHNSCHKIKLITSQSESYHFV